MTGSAFCGRFFLQMSHVVSVHLCIRFLSDCLFQLKNQPHPDRIVHMSHPMSDGGGTLSQGQTSVCVYALVFVCVTGWWMPPQFCQPSARLTAADWSCPPRMQFCSGGSDGACVLVVWCHKEPCLILWAQTLSANSLPTVSFLCFTLPTCTLGKSKLWVEVPKTLIETVWPLQRLPLQVPQGLVFNFT